MPIGDIRTTVDGTRIIRAPAVSGCSGCVLHPTLRMYGMSKVVCPRIISGNNENTNDDMLGPKGADCRNSIWHLAPPEKVVKVSKSLGIPKKAKCPAARIPAPYAPIGSSKSTKEQLLVSLGKTSEEVAKARSAEARIGTRLDRMAMNLKNARATINRLQKEAK